MLHAVSFVHLPLNQPVFQVSVFKPKGPIGLIHNLKVSLPLLHDSTLPY